MSVPPTVVSRRTIRLGFSDFWTGFNPQDNYFVRLLRPHYDLVITEKPDFLIFSSFGTRYRRHRGVRIFYTGECVEPDWDECDYAFDFEFFERPEHYRLPLYALYDDPAVLIQPSGFDPRRVLAQKTGFCCLVVSNPRPRERLEFFRVLSRYKRVDSGGRAFNNLGTLVHDKAAFLRAYKFVIAFENHCHAGYTTEKLFEALRAECVPIYWGNPQVHRDFNPHRFINAHDFPGWEALARHVLQVDQNDALYCRYLQEPCYIGNRVNEYVNPDNVRAQFARIFQTPICPIAQRQRLRRWARRRFRQLRRVYWKWRAAMSTRRIRPDLPTLTQGESHRRDIENMEN